MLDQFKNPAAHYRLAPLWLWGGELTPDEVERQIREMHAKGIGGFFIADAESEEGTARNNALRQHAIGTAQKLGMFACDGGRAASSSPSIGAIVDISMPDGSPATFFTARTGCGLESGCNVLTDKLAISTAHLAGLNRILLAQESSIDWEVSLREMKADIDRAVAIGYNAFSPYGFAYSVAECSNPAHEASPFYQSALWPHFRTLADYTARLCYAMSEGRHKAQVALLNPVKGFSRETDEEAMNLVYRFSLSFFNTYCEYLLREHVEFDIVCEESIATSLAVDQRIAIGNAEYELLILPPITSMGHKTAQRLVEYVEDGGALLGNVLLPVWDSDGSAHEHVRQVFEGIFGLDPRSLRARMLDGLVSGRPRLSHNHGNLLFYESDEAYHLAAGLRQMVSMAAKPEVSIKRGGAECHDILFQHRVLDEDDLFFFVNTASEPRDVNISVRCDKVPYVLNMENGGAEALTNCTLIGSRTEFAHRFRGHESLLVHFTDEIVLPPVPPNSQDGYEVVLSNEWRFEAPDHNILPLREWTRTAGDDQTHEEFTAAFDAETAPEHLQLVIPNWHRSVASAFVNGIPLRPAERWVIDVNFTAVEIGALVRAGRNEIRLVSANESVPQGVRLAGAFSLDSFTKTLRPPVEGVRTGSWTDHGYPYYSGTAVYSQAVDVPAFLSNQRVVLRADKPAEVVEFVVNDVCAGVRAWEPYEVDITHLVKPGINEVSLKITNTSANALAYQIRPSGLLGGARLIIF